MSQPDGGQTVKTFSNTISQEAQALLEDAEALENLTQLQQEFVRKKAAVDTQLSTAIQTHVEEARSGLALLQSCFDEIASIRTSFGDLNALWDECQILIDQSPVIKTVNTTQRNVSRTKEDVLTAVSVTDEVEDLAVMLLDDDNLLACHRYILQLMRKRNELLYFAKDNPQNLAVLQAHFQDVDLLHQQVTNKLWGALHNVLHLACTDPAMLVKVLRIIEREEKEDRLAKAAYEEAKTTGDEKVMAPFYLREPSSDPGTRRKVAKQHLALAIEARFTSIFDGAAAAAYEEAEEARQAAAQGGDPTHSEGGAEDDDGLPPIVTVDDDDDNSDGPIYPPLGPGDLGKILEAAETLINDLDIVIDDVVPCFPEQYDIFNYFAREYHKRLYMKVSICVNQADAMSAQEILKLVSWVQQYHQNLSDLGATEVEPKLTEGIDPLLQQYLIHVAGLMQEWSRNIVLNDFRSEQEPDQDPQGRFYTPAPVDLFKIFDQQVQVISEVSTEKLLDDVVSQCVRMLASFKQDNLDAIQGNWRSMSLERVCAVVNNFSKCMDLSEHFEEQMKEVLSEPYKSALDMEPTARDFLRAGKTASSVVVSHIFAEMVDEETEMPLFRQFFTKAWLEAPPDASLVSIVCATLDDFFDDLKIGLMDHYFKTVVRESLEKLAYIYLEPLLTRKDLKIDEEGTEIMTLDLDCIRQCFQPYVGEKIVEKYTKSIEDILAIIDADEGFFGLQVSKFRQSYPDTVIGFFEVIIGLRAGVDKKAQKGFLEEVRTVYDQPFNGTPEDNKGKPHLFAQILPNFFGGIGSNAKDDHGDGRPNESKPKANEKFQKKMKGLKERLLNRTGSSNSPKKKDKGAQQQQQQQQPASGKAGPPPLKQRQRKPSVEVEAISMDDL